VSDGVVLVVGGYGVVGRRIATALGGLYPGRVIVAGRNPEQAEKLVPAMDGAIRTRTVDITESSSITEALAGVEVVVSCIDQPDRLLLKAALARGLGYTDITPHLTELGRGSAYRDIVSGARASGARLILGCGLVPGISNVMVRALADGLGGADAIETSLLLGASDLSGPASLDYFLLELATTFDVYVDGTDHPYCALSTPRMIEFPPPIGSRTSYLFPFSDQVLYPNTMGVRTAVTRLALEPDFLARVLGLVAGSPLARLLTKATVRRIIGAALRVHRAQTASPFALRVDVARGPVSRHATLCGRAQADAAAAGAVEMARLLIDKELIEPGAWMPEQLAGPESILSRLAARGLTVDFPAG
jgi:saccharopine dehydrogenase-like NADP-dependent oxidoreductase